MYYSITFTDSSGNQKNTWEDWRLIPTSPPVIESPEVYTNYVEIPGRLEGPIDCSEALSGQPTFLNSEGSWEFVADDESYPRPILLQMLRSFLHGKRVKIQLEEDPYHYHIGRVSVSGVSTGNSNSVFSMDYTVSPMRYNRGDDTVEGV